jgi:hypothetical protein
VTAPDSDVRLAYAVVHEDPPLVLAADDLDVLQRVIALRVVANTPGATFPFGAAERLREALLEERWGDAVAQWIGHTGVAVDVYDDLVVWTGSMIGEPELGSVELQFAPLFER